MTLFYDDANLPSAERGWERRTIYRIVLRSPYPPQQLVTGKWEMLSIGLINEMSLFPKGALESGAKCCVEVSVDHGDVEVRGLDEMERKWMGLDDLRWPGYSGGRGACMIRVTNTTKQVRLKIGLARGQVEDSIKVIPLVIGTFDVLKREEDVKLTGDEMLYFYRPLRTSGSSILIKEAPEIAIPGKIWDSAIFAGPAALTMVEAMEKSEVHVIDLSTGTGVCGIWLAAALKQKKSRKIVTVTMTDVEEALNTIRDNVALNDDLEKGRLRICALPWGDEIASSVIATPDLIIACDLIYESDLLPLLYETFCSLSKPGTRILIGYKQRGLSIAEKSDTWQMFSKSFKVDRLSGEYLRSAVLDTELTADSVGVELWLLTMQ